MFFCWWEKLAKNLSYRRTYICLIILHDNYFFPKSNFGVRMGYVVVNPWKLYANCDNSEMKKRKRKVVWFNPLFSLNVKTNVGKIFLRLVKRHFAKERPIAHLTTNAWFARVVTRQMFKTILMMRRNFTLEFLKHLLRSVSEITRNNLLLRSIGIALNCQNIYGN